MRSGLLLLCFTLVAVAYADVQVDPGALADAATKAKRAADTLENAAAQARGDAPAETAFESVKKVRNQIPAGALILSTPPVP